MQKLRFSSVFWDFGGVITSSPFEAFSKFEIDNHLPKDEFDKLFKEESKSLGHEVNGG